MSTRKKMHAGDLLTFKAARDYRGSATMKPGAAYYVTGARVVVAGIPLRLARKPSVKNLVNMRVAAKDEDYHDRAARALIRAQEAVKAIEIYADMLEISVTQAKARITAQRLHNIANPLQDFIQEYDL